MGLDSGRTWTIVPIAECHMPGFHANVDRVARERRYLALLEAAPRAETEAFVRANIAKGHPQFVAVEDEKVIGWCDVVPLERPVFAHRGSLGMGVLPEYRGKGVGRGLIEATLEAAQRKGLARIDLEVRRDNLPAISLYRSVGFVEEGIKRKAFRVDGGYFDLLMMALWFDTDA